MPPLVVEDICRYSVNQQIGGQPVVNIVDMQIDTTGGGSTRQEAIEIVARDILDNWTDHFLPNQTTQITAQSVSWLDLDSLNGSVGEISSTDDITWPQAGELTSTGAMPSMVALRVDKATAGGRGTKRGRMYVAGLLESFTDAGVTQSWNAGTISDWNTQLQLFLDGINDEAGVVIGHQRKMAVVHQVGGVESWTEVTGLTANPAISTQVRRGTLR